VPDIVDSNNEEFCSARADNPDRNTHSWRRYPDGTRVCLDCNRKIVDAQEGDDA